jgi:hypothetical protein
VGIGSPSVARGKESEVSLDQKRARVFGVLYLLTFVTSILALVLYQTVLRHPVSYIASGEHDTQVLFAAFLELFLIITNIGTAVVIFPIVRRQNEELALGYVTARLFECMFILVGILAMLEIITLTQQVAGANEGTVAYTLAGIKDWTFLLGPGWVVGWGNGLILGYLMYRSELVPRRACWLGLIGGPALILTGTAILFTGNDPSDALRSLQGIATIPEFLWELFLGIYCTVKGFRPSSPILRDDAREDRVTAVPVSG